MRRFALTTAALAIACQSADLSPQLIDEFRQSLATRAADAEAQGSTTVVGIENWFFFGPELRHVSVGEFWGDTASTVSRARRADAADPLPAILDFKRQLDGLGVELLLVPVPPKVIVFPDKVGVDTPAIPLPVPRLDAAHATFYDLLRERGVDVLDLTERFLDERFQPESPLYCRHDTHWSGAGCVVASQAIADIVRARPWYDALETRGYNGQWSSTTIDGDLVRDVSPRPGREETLLRIVAPDNADAEPSDRSTVDDTSPIVLLGDSHALVFHAGDDMHAVDSGLVDQLALELGSPIDLVAVRGSGATAARVNLLRRAQADPTYWDNKRLVIWCFAAREFTEADGWRTVPITP